MAKRGKITEFFDTAEGKKQLEAVKGYIDEYIAHLDKVKPVKNIFSDAQKPSDYINGLKQMGELQAQQNKIVAEGVKATEKMIFSQREIDKLYVEGRLAKQAYNRELKNEVLLQNSVSGSIEEAKEKIKSLTLERNKLNLTTAEGVEKAKTFNQEIDRLNNFITENVAGLERRKINIGNYVESAQIVVGALGDVEKKLESLREKQAQLQNFSKTNPIGFKLGNAGDQLNQVNAQLAQTEQEFNALKNITSDPKFFNLAQVGSARTEVKGFTTTLIELEQKGLGNTQFANDLRKRLAELTDQIADTKDEIKAMASDSRSFDQLSSSVNFLTNSYQTFVGIQALAGDQSEETQETIKKLVAVQAVANGLQEVAEQLTKRGTIVNKAYVAVQGLVKTALDGTAAASVRAMAATKLLLGGLVIGGLVLLITKFIEWQKSLKEVSTQQKILNEVRQRAAEGYAKEVSQLEVLRLKLSDTNRPQSERIALAKEYNKTADKTNQIDVSQINNINLLNSAIDRQIAKIKERALAQAAANVTEEKAATLFKAEQAVTELDANFVLNLDRIDEQINEIKKKQDKIIADYQFTGKNQGAIIGLGKLRDALIAVKEANEDFSAAAKLTAKLPVGTPPPPQINTVTGKSSKEQKDQIEKDLKARFDLYKLEKERELELLDDIIKDESKTYIERLLAAINYVETKQKLIESEAAFEKTTGDKSAAEIALIDRKSAIERIKVAEETEKKIREIKKPDQKAPSATDIFTGPVPNSSVYNDIIKKLDEYKKKQLEIEAIEIRRKELLKEFANEMKETVFALFTAGIERQKNQIQESMDMIDQRKAKEIDAASQTALSEQDKAAKIAVIEARANAQKEQLDRRRRQLDQQKARFDKAKAIADIIQNTATAVMKTLAEFPPPAGLALAALVGALGAAQLVRALATPIPKYFKGRSKGDAYEGPAIVGDGGRSELIVREDGTMEVTPDTPTLTSVKKGDEILPDAEKVFRAALINQSMKAASMTDKPKDAGIQQLSKDIKDMKNGIVKAIQNKQENHFHFEKPLKRWVQTGNSSQFFNGG